MLALILKFLLRYARPFVPYYVVGAVMLVATNYAVVRIPALIGSALDVIGQGGGTVALSTSRSLAVELMAWALLLIVVRTLSRTLFFNPGRDIQFRLAVDLFGHLLTLPRPFYVRRKVGELVSIATNDTQSVRLLVGFAGLQVCNVAVAIPMHVAQMWATDATLMVWCATLVLVGGVHMIWTVRRFYGKSTEEAVGCAKAAIAGLDVETVMAGSGSGVRPLLALSLLVLISVLLLTVVPQCVGSQIFY